MPHSFPAAGLTNAEAAARLRAEGFNELPQGRSRKILGILADVVREPMLALLLGGGVIYLALGDGKEASILILFACLSVVITVVQETRTERVLELLRDLTSPRALVVRNGQQKRIAGREVVRGDVLVLGEGDRVPADALLQECHELLADESLLTGESVAVHKRAATPEDRASASPGGDGLPQVFAGTMVVRGRGLAVTTATGLRSEIGKIGHSLSTMKLEPPRLRLQVLSLVRIAFAMGLVVSLLAVALFGLTRGNWLEATLAGIALGMAMLPEEFPVVLTVFMAMGAWRMAQVRVLARRASAIETLGSATVLCTDKTGTLTENRMTVQKLWKQQGGALIEITAGAAPRERSWQDIVRTGALASAPEAFDPMDRAFLNLLGTPPGKDSAPEMKLVKAYGLRPDLLAVSNVWQGSSKKSLIVAAKGAPEAIAKLCKLAPSQRARLQEAANAMAADGLRVLGIATASAAPPRGGKFPCSQAAFQFRFLGLAGLADPLHASVPAAVRECQRAGIRVAMITGDYPVTARAIAKQAGIDASEVITGDELKALSDADLQARIKRCSIFARIVPQQKLRIVNAFKASGEIVAMTGDGVNDAPSLKAAHIGIAMGGRGTDVAREASSIVLLDDSFASIMHSVRMGRRIYDNLQKAIGFIFSVHVPIAGLAVLPLLLGLPIILWPIHIALLELVIDPVCSLAFEAEEEEGDLMQRPPRAPEAKLSPLPLIAWNMAQGAIAFGLVAFIAVMGQRAGLPENELRALAFFALVLCIVGLIFGQRNRSTSVFVSLSRPNRVLTAVLLVTACLMAAILLVPQLAMLFRFGPLHLHDLALTLGAGFVTLLAMDMLKHWRPRMASRQGLPPASKDR